MGRIVLAAIAASVAMFVMMAILHMSPIAHIGISQMTNDAPALAALQTATGNKPGLYLFPSGDMKQMDARMKVEPSGIMAYRPPNAGGGISPKLLFAEYVKELAQAVFAAVLLSFAVIATYWGRVGFVILIGVVSTLTTNISYWNWYSFPTNYTLANMFIEIMGFVAAGLVLGAMIKRRRA